MKLMPLMETLNAGRGPNARDDALGTDPLDVSVLIKAQALFVVELEGPIVGRLGSSVGVSIPTPVSVFCEILRSGGGDAVKLGLLTPGELGISVGVSRPDPVSVL